MAAVGLPATRSHDTEWLFFFGRVLYKYIIPVSEKVLHNSIRYDRDARMLKIDQTIPFVHPVYLAEAYKKAEPRKTWSEEDGNRNQSP
jgi:hypothetical protein